MTKKERIAHFTGKLVAYSEIENMLHKVLDHVQSQRNEAEQELMPWRRPPEKKPRKR